MGLKNKGNLSRADLKHNFLKTIIIRFDFYGISAIELDGLIPEIKNVLKLKGYDTLVNELATELDFEFDDPEKAEIEGLQVQNVRKQQVYVFKNQKAGIQLKISPVFAFIHIEKVHYMDFFAYSDALSDIVRILREKIPFFIPTRFGLRKINQCILMDVKEINNYFDSSFLSLYAVKDDKIKISQTKDCFLRGDYNVNYIRSVMRGEYDNKDAYQVVLDADVYLIDTEKVNDLICDPDKMKPMNELLFELYKSALTEEFVKKMQNKKFNDDKIIGVESNEE